MTTAVTGAELADVLRLRFTDKVEMADDTGVWVTPEFILEMCTFLHNDPHERHGPIDASSDTER